MRMRKKANEIPRMEHCSHLLVSNPEDAHGRWRELICRDFKRIYIELGCGKGQFTTNMAMQNPDDFFIAIERINSALVIAMERADKLGLQNLLFISGDAAKLPQYFDSGEIDGIFINFCDPWPARKHIKRRLTSPGFLHIYRDILKEGGQIHFKTDNAPLFSYSTEQFLACGFRLDAVTHDLHANGICGVMTDYEEKFHSQGMAICSLTAIR